MINIPILEQGEVLVIGGGPSGIAAAIAAAREGAKTILLERSSCFGGNITQVGVEAFAWYRHEGTVEAGGITTEIEETAKKMGALPFLLCSAPIKICGSRSIWNLYRKEYLRL